MNALYQRSQGIPRLINIIADRSLISAFAKERLDVTAAMVHEAANEVQLGERQVKRVRWPLWLGAGAAAAVAVLAVATFTDFRLPAGSTSPENVEAVQPVVQQSEPQTAALAPPEPQLEPEPEPEPEPAVLELPVDLEIKALDKTWLEEHQQVVWQGLAEMWGQPGAAFTIQAACNGDNSLGYACLRDQGNWSKINHLGLPVVLVLQGELPGYLLLQGVDNDRLLVGYGDQSATVSRDSVEPRWLGTYLVAWPQAADWPPFVGRGDTGPAVSTIMDMAARVDEPYDGQPVFDAAFELWLKNFQLRNGLQSDGIVGRNTLLHLMTASIEEPKLRRTWE
jgi:general secretion pathway protein A